MAIEDRTLSGKNPRLTINLTEMFGGQRVPDSSAFKQSVGQAIIDTIVERTQDGVSRKGSAFKSYSLLYAKSLDFIAAGKSRSQPNLTLQGDMLGTLEIIEEGRSTITLGFTSRKQQLKAHGHITGDPRGPGVKRDFLGLPSLAYDEIASNFTVPEEVSETTESGFLSALLTLRDIFGDS